MSGALRINLPNLPQVRSELGAVRTWIRSEVRGLLNRTADRTLRRVQELTPKDTGETARKWRLFAINRRGPEGKAQGAFFAAIDHPYNRPGATRTVVGSDGKRRRQVVNDGQRSLLTDLEYGTRAHVIVPKKPGGVLRFQIGGKTITTKSVQHPGTRAYNMTTIAAAEAQRDVGAGLIRIERRAVTMIEAIK